MRAQPVELDKELSVEFHSALSVPPQALPSNSLTANDAAKGLDQSSAWAAEAHRFECL